MYHTIRKEVNESSGLVAYYFYTQPIQGIFCLYSYNNEWSVMWSTLAYGEIFDLPETSALEILVVSGISMQELEKIEEWFPRGRIMDIEDVRMWMNEDLGVNTK